MFNLRGHSHSVWSVAFSPDGERLASASQDGTAKIWEMTRRQEVLSVPETWGPVTWVAFSPDGTWLALVQTGRGVILLDGTPVAEERRGTWEVPRSLSPESRLLRSCPRR